MVSLSQQQQRTVGFLKPDVIDRKTELMDLIKSNPQWEVTFEQELILSLGEAKVLYPQEDEASWLSSHPIYVFVLEGPNVVQNWLDYVGAKDPKEAKLASPQSLRACFGLDSLHNVCHATGSDKEAYHDLKWLQGLVVDDLSIPLDLDLENSNQSSQSSQSSQSNQSNQSNKSPQPSKLSKLKKPTTVAASKIGVTSAASAATTGAHKSSSSSDAKKKSSMAIPRPRSSLGSRPTTPASGSKQGTTTKAQKTTPAMPSTAKIPSLKTPTTTATSAAKKPTTATTAARSSRAPTAKGRKETKSSRLGARSESSAKQSPDSVTSTGPSNTKRLANTRGISKNTPGISVLTGRTRKNSRVGDRRKETPAPTNHTDDSGSTTGAVSSEDTLDSITEYKNDDDKVPDNDTTTTDDLPNNGNNNNNNNNNTPYATESVTSASTSCSQHTSDHDAEVAAAMGVRIDSPSDLMDRRRSSSFSPASVASSLTRPETPEVDQLRQRFESLGKPSTTPTTTTKRTPSITPEVASRIKDLKPKDPAGSRVKSMVEFFMDEKLHKWEF